MTSGMMRFDGDRLATFTTSFNANGVSDFRVVGTEGNIHAEPAYEYAEALGYTLTVGDNDAEEEGPPPRSVRRGDRLLLGLRAEGQGSGAVGRRRLLGRARRQRAVSVGGERRAGRAATLRPEEAADERRRVQDFPPVRRNPNWSRSRNRTTKTSRIRWIYSLIVIVIELLHGVGHVSHGPTSVIFV